MKVVCYYIKTCYPRLHVWDGRNQRHIAQNAYLSRSNSVVTARNKEMFFAHFYPQTLDPIFLDFNSSTLYKFILKLKNAKIFVNVVPSAAALPLYFFY